MVRKQGGEEMKELKIIEEKEVLGNRFRIYGDYDNLLFLAKDVAADTLGYSIDHTFTPHRKAKKILENLTVHNSK